MSKWAGLKKQRKQQILIVLVFALIGFCAAYAFSARDKKTSDAEIFSSSCSVDTCVALTETGAQPDTVTVKKSSFVQFNSADGKTHSLSLGKGGEEHEHTNKKFQSGDFNGDEAWRVQLNDEGSFFFHDHYNPKINILVVVYTPGKDYKIIR